MRKDIKRRLEKALITLQEPEGSTIRAIMLTINKEAPILTLRKVLEALQDGISEGFLYMYNGRFKLRGTGHSRKDLIEDPMVEKEANFNKQNSGRKTPDSDLFDDDSDLESDFDELEDVPRVNDFLKTSKKFVTNNVKKLAGKRRRLSQSHMTLNPHTSKGTRKTRFIAKEESIKTKLKGENSRKVKKHSRNPAKVDCSVLELTSTNILDNRSRKPTEEKPDLKKQRGPRCTSMKKDISLPSKVHIPFVPPSVPQRTSNFNDLLRGSPEPVNGPLYDNFVFTNENVGFFGVL